MDDIQAHLEQGERGRLVATILVYCSFDGVNGLNCVLPLPHNPYVESYSPVLQNVAMFGTSVFTELIKLKWGD